MALGPSSPRPHSGITGSDQWEPRGFSQGVDMKKAVMGIGLLALILIGGAFAFVANQDQPAGEKSSASEAAPASGNAATDGEPVASAPVDGEDAQLFMEINQAIFEVTQEAAKRPQNDRMTSEEVNQLITSKIQEIKRNR